MVPEASISQGGLCCIENSKGEWGQGLGVGLSQKPKILTEGMNKTWNFQRNEGGREGEVLSQTSYVGGVFSTGTNWVLAVCCIFSIILMICMLVVIISVVLRLFSARKIVE